jgi:hypothetical protein
MQLNLPGDNNLHRHIRENLKPNIYALNFITMIIYLMNVHTYRIGNIRDKHATVVKEWIHFVVFISDIKHVYIKATKYVSVYF